MTAEEYREEYAQMGDITVRIITYRLGPRYHCHVENLDPRVPLARSEGSSRDEALRAATSKALDRKAVNLRDAVSIGNEGKRASE